MTANQEESQMLAAAQTAKLIAQAYRWQRRLGNESIPTPYGHIVANRSHPEVWDANHADDVSAQTEGEIAAIFAAMDAHLSHCPWRVVHTDGFTPDVFLARLALEDFQEQPATIQMALLGTVAERGAKIVLRAVEGDGDWAALRRLVAADHAEGRRTADLALEEAFIGSMVASYQSKCADYRFNLVVEDGEPVAYGAYAVAPNGAGMIEDLFTLRSARRKGIATAMIAAFCDELGRQGCQTIFLGALASEPPKRHYARLGFRPVGLGRTWVRRQPGALEPNQSSAPSSRNGAGGKTGAVPLDVQPPDSAGDSDT